MKNLSYNLSPALQKSLQLFENTRRDILLTSLSPKTEMRLRWEMTIDKIYATLALSGNPLSKKTVYDILSHTPPKRPTRQQQEILNYKHALDVLRDQWLVNKRSVTFTTVDSLAQYLYSNTDNAYVYKTLRTVQPGIQQLLEYIDQRSDHPLIDGATCCMQTVVIAGIDIMRLGLTLLELFLHKSGVDVRGFLSLPDYWLRDRDTFDAIIRTTMSSGDFTKWLEYVAQSAVVQLEKVQQDLAQTGFRTELPAKFWELNDRQRAILRILEQPGVIMTNKKVQKEFGISQITASRDLGKLAIQGLLYLHGKGRSIYYTTV